MDVPGKGKFDTILPSNINPGDLLKMSSKETVGLDSDALNDYVKQVMSIPEQVVWFKRFLVKMCPCLVFILMVR